jgi:hypothetical protein
MSHGRPLRRVLTAASRVAEGAQRAVRRHARGGLLIWATRRRRVVVQVATRLGWNVTETDAELSMGMTPEEGVREKPLEGGWRVTVKWIGTAQRQESSRVCFVVEPTGTLPKLRVRGSVRPVATGYA